MKERPDFKQQQDEWAPPPEFLISPPRRMQWTTAGRMNYIVAYLFGFLGFGVLCAVWSAAYGDHQLKYAAQVADGVVTRTWTQDLKSVHYNVAYEFPAAGKTVKGESELSKRKWQKLSRGSSIQVKYVAYDTSINRPAIAYERLLPYWLLLVIFLGWIGMLALSIYPIHKQKRLLKYGMAVAGVVTRAQSGGRPKYGWVTGYEYQLHDGTVIKGSTQRDRTYYNGQNVSVIYDPKHPKRSEIYPLRFGRILE